MSMPLGKCNIKYDISLKNLNLVLQKQVQDHKNPWIPCGYSYVSHVYSKSRQIQNSRVQQFLHFFFLFSHRRRQTKQIHTHLSSLCVCVCKEKERERERRADQTRQDQNQTRQDKKKRNTETFSLFAGPSLCCLSSHFVSSLMRLLPYLTIPLPPCVCV